MLTEEMAAYLSSVRGDITDAICASNPVLCSRGTVAIFNHWWSSIRPTSAEERQHPHSATAFVKIEDWARSLGYAGPGLVDPIVIQPDTGKKTGTDDRDELGNLAAWVKKNMLVTAVVGTGAILILTGVFKRT